MARGKRRSRDDLDELSRLLLDLRERAELRQEQVADQLGVSQSMISRCESGKGVPDEALAAKLARLYQATPEDRRRLTELATVMKSEQMDSRLIMQRGRNIKFQNRIAQIERSCALVRAYSPYMVLGALQTAGYAREVFTTSTAATPDEADRLVASRTGRYRAMVEENQRRWLLLMAEAALNTHVGSPTLMADQMTHLIEATRLPNVRVGIIPNRAPVRVFAAHGFDLYDSRAVCIGTATATALTAEPGDVAVYEALTEALTESAVYDDQVRTILARVADDYRRLA